MANGLVFWHLVLPATNRPATPVLYAEAKRVEYYENIPTVYSRGWQKVTCGPCCN